MIGNTLSHYRIIDKLGAGGMGEVYRAHDTTLDRQVAIKVLPDIFSGDRERLARFEREAKLLASLNHPNIASIYGLEEAGGKRFLVLELVEGETLAQRIAKGPLPVEEALEVCRQIAEGLEAAHEKEVIHRDLKPANIKVTPEGKVKILDFGLAKALADEAQPADASQSPTITEAMTRPGVVLGTAAYMSPEQAKGKTVDKRADIWAFGCILYECLTGKAPFKGETVTETLAKILEGTPDWNLLPPSTPSGAKELLHRCLQRNPRERLRDIGDARLEMQLELPKAAEIVPVAQSFPLRWISISTFALVIGVLLGLALMKYYRPASSPLSQAVVRFPVRLEPGLWLDGQRVSAPYGFDHPTRTAMVLSSDGRFIVYAAIKGNPGTQDKPQLYLRKLDQLEAKPIAGTEGGISPFLSPDDRWVGFHANGKLMKVSIDGEIAATLCVAGPYGFSWRTDGKIVFAPGFNTGLSRISAEGGKPEKLTKPDASRDEYSHRLPHCLPGGKGILFTITKSFFDINPRIAVLELGTGKWRVLVEDGADARYVRTGHLAFLRQGMLMTIPFDPDTLEITGEAAPAVAAISQALNTFNGTTDTGAGQFGISASGSLVYATGGILLDRENSLVWVDRKGNAEPITSYKAAFFAPRLSPDGQRIAYSTLAKEKQIWIYDLNRDTPTRLTSEGDANWVTWLPPDGKRVLFRWGKTGQLNIFWQAVDGSSAMERLTQSEYAQSPSSCSPDGQTLAFVGGSPSTGNDVMLLNMISRQVTPFLNPRFGEDYPEFSPNGHWLAYGSNESGRDEVYVQPFPGPGGKWQISDEGGAEPLWARNGKQLFYRRSPGQVWVVDIQSGSGFTVSKPRLLFEKPGYTGGSGISGWDVSLDGQRFLMVKMGERKPQPITEMIFVEHWSEELKRLVPTK